MMVETMLDSSQDFGMAGALPQWKRELLQRRAARARPPAPPPPPPPPPEPEAAEELRYGPGIVKRLKSRYLSLALREAPRRRASVLRRAASLEHLLDEPRVAAPRPASLAAPPPHAAPARRDLVKRARSVDALSRLEAREEPPSPPAPPPRPAGSAGRAPRPPRRPAPLLREAERPPPDVVRSALRRFESAPARRAPGAARLPAVLRGRERRSTTPEREPERQPSPAPATPPPLPATPPPVTEPVELEPPAPDIPSSNPKTPEPEVIPTIPAMIVLKVSTEVPQKTVAPTLAPTPASVPVPSPGPAPAPVAEAGTDEVESAGSRRVARAALEEIARAGSSVRFSFAAARGGSHLPPLAATNPVLVARRVGVIRPMPAPRLNGHAAGRIGRAGIERAWSGGAPADEARAPWARGRPPPCTSVVFNFSGRKEVPDYIENDGIILRAARRHRIKAGEPGVVALRAGAGGPGAGSAGSAGSDEEDEAVEPCRVRFVNDNVLINGRSSMPARGARDRPRAAKLKLQFDDSLTRTFEYPSETSVCEDSPPASPALPAPPAPPAPAGVTSPEAPAPAPQLADNTHIASAALSRYTPSKTAAASFQLGLAPAPAVPLAPAIHEESMFPACGAEGEEAPHAVPCGAEGEAAPHAVPCGAEGEAAPHAVPCGADAARAWSDARLATDLLF